VADPLLHPTVLRVRATLTALGVPGEVRALTDAVRTAQAAADALGVEVGQIASSLVFVIEPDRTPLLVLTSGAHRVDTAKVADLLAVPGLGRADADDVRAATGMAIGGVAPVGHPAPVRTLVDVALARYDVVWAAAGHPHTLFPTTYDELVRCTGGQPAEVA
jgi:prolyl-tRNA editing enzyme YbaK/EbsC (Cys-tRNA(Pro) deacylase)